MQLKQIMDNKIQRDQKPGPPLLRSKEQKQVTACPLNIPPTKQWVNHLSHPSTGLLDTPLPSPNIRNQLTSLIWEWLGREPVASPSSGPHNALPEFPVWPLINFYRVRRPRTLVNVTIMWEIMRVFKDKTFLTIWRAINRKISDQTFQGHTEFQELWTYISGRVEEKYEWYSPYKPKFRHTFCFS